MKDELNLTIKILKDQKKYISILESTNDLKNINTMEILYNIYKIDLKIKEYNEDLTDDNIFKIPQKDIKIKSEDLEEKRINKKSKNISLTRKKIVNVHIRKQIQKNLKQKIQIQIMRVKILKLK